MTLDKSEPSEEPPGFEWFIHNPVQGIYYALIGAGVLGSLLLGLSGVLYGVGWITNQYLNQTLAIHEYIFLGLIVVFVVLFGLVGVYVFSVMGAAILFLLGEIEQ